MTIVTKLPLFIRQFCLSQNRRLYRNQRHGYHAAVWADDAGRSSLLIIAAKSLIGFTGDLAGLQIDWAMLLPVSGLAIAGFYIGDRLSVRLSAPRLQQAFGWFVLSMGVYVILKELL